MTIKTVIAIILVILAVLYIALMIRVKGLKKCLEWAVIEAEKALGSSTGKAKLRMVYNIALGYFPIIATIIPFKVFSKMVDNALDVMEELIESNSSIKNYVEGE